MVTPSLFQQAASALTPQWDLMEGVNDLQLQGVVNSAVDILTRRIIQSIVYYDVRMHVISWDLIGLLSVMCNCLSFPRMDCIFTWLSYLNQSNHI